MNVLAVAARTLRAAGDGEGAEALLGAALERHPSAAALWVERGALLLDRRNLAGARAAFTRAAALAPGAFEPVAGLTNADVAAGQTRAARQRLAPHVNGAAPDPRLLVLAGQLAASDRDATEAERLLKRAVRVGTGPARRLRGAGAPVRLGGPARRGEGRILAPCRDAPGRGPHDGRSHRRGAGAAGRRPRGLRAGARGRSTGAGRREQPGVAAGQRRRGSSNVPAASRSPRTAACRIGPR